MFEVRLVQANRIMPVVEELLDIGKRVRITVTGMSMYPFLRGNKDSVELISTNYQEVRRGDIVLVLRDNNQFVLHRIIKKKKKNFYLNGDAQQWSEGPIFPEQIVAKVITVWRGDKSISCSSRGWRILSLLWRFLFPIRCFTIKLYGRFHRVITNKARSKLL